MGFFSRLKGYFSKAVTYVSNVVRSGFRVSAEKGNLTIRSMHDKGLALNYDSKCKNIGLESSIRGFHINGAYNFGDDAVTATVDNDSAAFRLKYSRPSSTISLGVVNSGLYFSNEYNHSMGSDTIKVRTSSGSALEATLSKNTVPVVPRTIPTGSRIFVALRAKSLFDIVRDLYARTPFGRIDYSGGVAAYSY
jgi:hypothetical protein